MHSFGVFLMGMGVGGLICSLALQLSGVCV